MGMSSPPPAVSWTCFPITSAPPEPVAQVAAIFMAAASRISSQHEASRHLDSNGVLSELRPELEALGFDVEGPQHVVKLPVLFGEGGVARRTLRADAWWPDQGVVVEIEAGGARQNNRALLDLLKGVVWADCRHLLIAVKKAYGQSGQNDYEWLLDWLSLLYATDRVALPMESVTVLGY